MNFIDVYEYLRKKFDDGPVNSPMQLTHVTQVQFLMSTVGAWPHEKFGRPRLGAILSIYNLFVIAVVFTIFTLTSIYIRINIEILSFFDLGHDVLCWFFDILFAQRLFTSRFQKYAETIRDYLSEFHLYYYKGRSTYAAKVYEQIHVLSSMFTLYVIFQISFGMSLFNFMPWYNNYSRGMFSDHRPENSTFEHAVYYYLPDSVYTTISGYWVLFIINMPISYITTIGLCVYDLLLSLIVLQIWGHLRILNHNLLRLPLPDNRTMYSKEENKKINILLKDNINHHNVIVNFVDGCTDAFSEYLFAFYLLMQFITCILALEVSSFTADAIVKYAPLTFNMYQQLIYISILFEILNTKSEQLIDAVYAVPWEYMDSTNRKMVMFFLQRVQSPVSLKAAKVVPVGVNTMLSVIKTTCSYYMLLKTVAVEQEQ